jgi:hypothetical protein
MPRFLIGFLCAVAAAQQPAELFSKAPPPVDAALRARISKFYQLHVESKFRQAEALVAEDTKDFFYTANKPRYLSFEISRIDYSDEFRMAKATVIVETIVPVIGFADRPLKVPIPSYWKIENDDWFWYVDQEALNKTPWGTRKAPPPGAASTAPSSGPAQAMPDPRQLLQNIAKQVKADKNALRLTPGGSGEIAIQNHLPGEITLAIEGAVPEGLKAAIDRPALKAGEKAVVAISAKPDMAAPDAPLSVGVRVHPTNQLLSIQVTIAAR